MDGDACLYSPKESVTLVCSVSTRLVRLCRNYSLVIMLFVDISAHISLHKGTWYEGYSIDSVPTCGKVARWVVTSKSWPPGHGDLCDLHSSFAWRTGRPSLVIPLPLKKMEQLNNTFCHFPTNSSNNTSHSASQCSSPVKVLSCPQAKGAQSFLAQNKNG